MRLKKALLSAVLIGLSFSCLAAQTPHVKNSGQCYPKYQTTEEFSSYSVIERREGNVSVGVPTDPNHSYNRTKGFMVDHHERE